MQYNVIESLEQGYFLWERFGLEPLSEIEKYSISKYVFDFYKGRNKEDFAIACQCFYLFRKLHKAQGDKLDVETLLGDYFFSRFSHHIIPIDSTELIQEFSKYLSEDILKEVKGNQETGNDDYLKFIYRVSLMIE